MPNKEYEKSTFLYILKFKPSIVFFRKNHLSRDPTSHRYAVLTGFNLYRHDIRLSVILRRLARVRQGSGRCRGYQRFRVIPTWLGAFYAVIGSLPFWKEVRQRRAIRPPPTSGSRQPEEVRALQSAGWRNRKCHPKQAPCLSFTLWHNVGSTITRWAFFTTSKRVYNL